MPKLIPLKRAIARIRRARNRLLGPSRLVTYLGTTPTPKLVIGFGTRYQGPDWFPTDKEFLDLLKPSDWERFLQPGTVAAMLAEHVWEHLTLEQGLEAARTCYAYLRASGYLRIAVPDGFHPSPEYIEWVRPGGRSPMQAINGHRVLYTYQSLKRLLETAGFRVQFYEYFDEAGQFHCQHWDPWLGMIQRSRRFDKRNRNGQLVFTSIIADAIKD